LAFLPKAELLLNKVLTHEIDNYYFTSFCFRFNFASLNDISDIFGKTLDLFLFMLRWCMRNDIKRSVINALKKNNPAILKHPDFSNYLVPYF